MTYGREYITESSVNDAMFNIFIFSGHINNDTSEDEK